MANYPYQNYQPPYQGFQQRQGEYICRPVTCREEAVSAPVDYFSPLVLPDLGHGVIYLKRFNPQTGASDFAEFRAVQPEPPQQYVTVEEFNAFREELKKKRRKSDDDTE